MQIGFREKARGNQAVKEQRAEITGVITQCRTTGADTQAH